MIIDSPLIAAERAEELLNKEPKEAKSTLGDLGIEWLDSAISHKLLIPGKREYQREKVAETPWKQAIINTILTSAYARIPQVHIRVLVDDNGNMHFELVDGQQRCTAITDFITGEYPLGEIVLDGQDMTGKYFSELDKKYQIMIHGYRISCIWYEGLDDEDTANLFVDILNNTNNLNYQEKRNALRSFLISWVRDKARPGKGQKTDPLFERIVKNDKEILECFKLNLKGRMELDEWILECCFFLKNGVVKGLTQKKLTKWVIAQHKDEYASEARFAKDKKMFEKFFHHTYKCVQNTPKEYKNKLNGMTTQMFSLYAWELLEKYGKLDYAQYATAFFDTYTRWSTDKTLYLNETEADGTQMPPFYELFGGKNANAIKTIWKVLDMEQAKGLDFGVIELDPRETFPKWMIEKKWAEQDFKDGYDGKKLSEDNLAGDHDIPRSWGIAAGGVTEYDNLVVTSISHNAAKSNMSGDDYRNQV